MQKYLRVANVFDGFIDYSDVLEMPFTESERAIYYLNPGDILLNEGQSLELVGRSAIYDGKRNEYCFQNTLIRFRPSASISSQFALQVFRHFLHTGEFAAIAARTTSIAHLGVERFASMLIPLPPLHEQKAISEVLSAWDRAIGQTSALIAAKEQLKLGLMQQLLTGARRLKGFNSEWNNVEIGQHLEECATRVSSTTNLPIFTSSRSGLKPQGEYYGGRNVKNDGEYGVVPNDCFVFRHMSDDGLFVFHINRTGGDIAVSKEYPVFRAVNLDQDFLLAKLNHSPDFKAFALAEKAGGTRTRLHFSRLRLWRTSVPSLQEQRRIAEVLNGAEEEIRILRRQLEALKKQKKGLMQKLLTGEVRVSEKLMKQGTKP